MDDKRVDNLISRVSHNNFSGLHAPFPRAVMSGERWRWGFQWLRNVRRPRRAVHAPAARERTQKEIIIHTPEYRTYIGVHERLSQPLRIRNAARISRYDVQGVRKRRIRRQPINGGGHTVTRS